MRVTRPRTVSLRRKNQNLLWSWLPVVLWLGIIAVESTDLLSAAHTGTWLYQVVTRIFGAIDAQLFDVFHAVLRKFGHFIGYAILCVLMFRALAATFRRAAVFPLRWAAASVAFTFLVASLDEWHQSFLSSRTGSFRDVVLDTAGAVCLQAVVLLAMRLQVGKTAETVESVSN